MEKPLRKSISRRRFLQGLLAFIAWPVVSRFPVIKDETQQKTATIEVSGPVEKPMVFKDGGTIETEGQAWGFPLAFPVFFLPTEREEHKVFLPLITKGGI